MIVSPLRSHQSLGNDSISRQETDRLICPHPIQLRPRRAQSGRRRQSQRQMDLRSPHSQLQLIRSNPRRIKSQLRPTTVNLNESNLSLKPFRLPLHSPLRPHLDRPLFFQLSVDIICHLPPAFINPEIIQLRHQRLLHRRISLITIHRHPIFTLLLQISSIGPLGIHLLPSPPLITQTSHARIQPTILHRVL